MKYTVSIEGNQLIFTFKRGKRLVFNIDEVSGFAISNIDTDLFTPLLVMGKPFLAEKKNPITYGSIIIGFKECSTKEIQKSKYKKEIRIYKIIKIKHVHNIFDIANKLINLGIHLVAIPYKQIYKYTLNNKKFYSKEIYYGENGKTTITNCKTPECW